MKKIFLLIVCLSLFGISFAQEIDNPLYKFDGVVLSNELTFTASSAQETEKIHVSIFPANKKAEPNEKITRLYELTTEPKTFHIDISTLPQGEYQIVSVKGVRGRVFTKYFRKN